MTSTMPQCTNCKGLYSTPTVLPQNSGLCPACRPIKVCCKCDGRGEAFLAETTFVKKRPVFGQWVKCVACDGTRHERTDEQEPKP